MAFAVPCLDSKCYYGKWLSQLWGLKQKVKVNRLKMKCFQKIIQIWFCMQPACSLFLWNICSNFFLKIGFFWYQISNSCHLHIFFQHESQLSYFLNNCFVYFNIPLARQTFQAIFTLHWNLIQIILSFKVSKASYI